MQLEMDNSSPTRSFNCTDEVIDEKRMKMATTTATTTFNGSKQHEQFCEQSKNKLWTTKVFVISMLLCIVWLGKKYATPSISVDQLSDPTHDATAHLNALVNSHKEYAMIFQISSSILMDFSFFTICIFWVLRIKTGRLLYVMACFYIFRGINQALVIFPFPQGYYWEYPDFPAYVTPYGRTSDFFYSGHVGFLNILALEWYTQKKMFMFKLTVIFNVYIAFVMIVFRIHYAIDITTGLVVSHYIFMLINQNIDTLDAVFKRIYNRAENIIEQKSCGSDDFHTAERFYDEDIEINVQH